MKLNIIFTALLVTASSFCSQSSLVEKAALSPRTSAILKLTKQGYIVTHDKVKTAIPSYDVHKELRKMTKSQLKAYQAKHHVVLRRMMDGSIQVEPGHGLKGGGLVGAKIGFWVGKIGVHVGARIGFLIAAACTGPAAPATYAGLEATFLVPLEAASNAAGIACGILGGVATGPV